MPADFTNLKQFVHLAIYVGFILLYAPTVLVLCTSAVGFAFPAFRVVNSIFAALYTAFAFKYKRLFSIASIALVVLATRHREYLSMPPLGSSTRHWGSTVSAWLFYSWLTAAFPRAGGLRTVSMLPRDDRTARRLRWVALFTSMRWIIPVFTVAHFFPEPFGFFGMTAALVSAVAKQHSELWLLAMFRRARSPRTEQVQTIATTEAPYAVQLSDLHVTRPGAKPAGAGHGGYENLAWLTSRWLANPGMAPTMLLIAGDLIDHGDSSEWQHILPMLRKLRSIGMHILIAPGNHDLGTAYDYHASFAYLLVSSAGGRRAVNTRPLKRFLQAAAEMDDGLCCHDGRMLTGVLASEESEFDAFVESWRTAAQAAAGLLRKSSDAVYQNDIEHPSPNTLQILGAWRPEDLRSLMGPVIERAAPIFGLDPKTMVLDDFLGRCPPRFSVNVSGSIPEFRLPLLLLDQRWQRFWYASFPLRVFLEGPEVEVLIVNSIHPEAGLLGSAFGRLTGPQIERLSQMVAATRAKTLVILMHHPITAWVEAREDTPRKRGATNRWALLAHETVECSQLVEMLKRCVAPSCSKVYLCGGHRHGPSRVGRLLGEDGRPDPAAARIMVMESGASMNTSPRMPPKSAGVVIGLQLSADKTLQPCVVSFDDRH